jgi:glycosyltransferase 2 family protein
MRRASLNSIFTGLKLGFAAAIIAYLFVGGALDFGPILDLLRERAGVVASAAAVTFVSVILSGVRWWMVMRAAGLRLPFGLVLRLHLIGMFFSTWLPGAVGGDAARGAYVVRALDTRRTTALLTVVIDRLFSLFGLVVVVAILVAFHLGRVGAAPILTFYGVFTIGIIVLAVAGAFLVHAAAARLTVGDGPRLQRLRPYARQLQSAVVLIGSARGTLLLCTAVSVLASVVVVLGVVVISSGFPFAPDPIVTGLAAAVATISSAVPLTPGGLGIGEMAFAQVCEQVAGATGPLATIYLSFRIVAALVSCSGVLPWLFFEAKTTGRQGRTDHAPGVET